MLEIVTKNYGFIAYLMLKYNAVKIPDGIKVKTDKDRFELIKEYNDSDFHIFNELLKEVLRGK